MRYSWLLGIFFTCQLLAQDEPSLYIGSIAGIKKHDEIKGRWIEILGQHLVKENGRLQTKMYISITDSAGEFDGSLVKEDFILEVNGQPVRFELSCQGKSLPVDLALVLDGSDSFKKELITIANIIKDFDTEVEQLGFADLGYWPVRFTNKIVPLSKKFYTSSTELSRLLEKLSSAGNGRRGWENTSAALLFAANKIIFREQAVRSVILITDEAYQGGTNQPIPVSKRVINNLEDSRVTVYPLIGNIDPESWFVTSYNKINENEEKKFQYIAAQTGGELVWFNEEVDLGTGLRQILNLIKDKVRYYYCIIYPYPINQLTADIGIGLSGSGPVINCKAVPNSSIPTKKPSDYEIVELKKYIKNPSLIKLIDDPNYDFYFMELMPFATGRSDIISERIKSSLDEFHLIIDNEDYKIPKSFIIISGASPEWLFPDSLNADEIDEKNIELSSARLKSSLNELQKYVIFQSADIDTLDSGRNNPLIETDLDKLDSKQISIRATKLPSIEHLLKSYRSTWVGFFKKKDE